MGVLTVLKSPNPRLKRVSKVVETFDEALEVLVNNMAETMYSENGIGLAAPQVDEPIRLFVTDTKAGSDDPSDFRVFVNPEVTLDKTEMVDSREGCLSVRDRLGVV